MQGAQKKYQRKLARNKSALISEKKMGSRRYSQIKTQMGAEKNLRKLARKKKNTSHAEERRKRNLRKSARKKSA
jgi:hypothetical protein